MSASATDAKTFITELRERTSELHKELDSLPVASILMQENLTKEAYANYLLAMLAVIESAEEKAMAKVSFFADKTDIGSRSASIRRDLQVVGVEAPEKNNLLFPIHSDAEAYGVTYVVEGSSLGGLYMLKNVTAQLGYDKENGASFLFGKGPATGPEWREFLEHLTQYAEKEGNQEAIMASAEEAFRTVYKHLSQF